jgi:hypothetical protein
MELERLPSKGSILLPLAKRLSRDEKALMLVEEDRMTEDLLEEHRFQIIYVGRGDRVYAFPRDLGRTSNFRGISGFIFLSGGEDSVAALMDMADTERGENRMKAVLEEAAANSTMKQDAIDLLEQKRELVKRNTRTLRRDYGLPTVERNLY